LAAEIGRIAVQGQPREMFERSHGLEVWLKQ
jgi:hypothetical protein